MSNLPQLLILAGGMARRLKPMSNQVPKSLIEIKGKPFIYYQLEQARSRGINNVVICIGNLGNEVRKNVGNGEKFNLNIKYSDEGNNLLGTGGAIRNATNLLEDYFFVLYGDSWINTIYQELYNHIKLSGFRAIITVFKNNNKWDNSNISINENIVLSYQKSKNKNSNYIDYGLSLLPKKIFMKYKEKDAFDLGTVYKRLVKQKQLEAFEVYDRFYEIGSFKGITETSDNLQKYL